MFIMHDSLNGRDCQILPGQYLNIVRAVSGNHWPVNAHNMCQYVPNITIIIIIVFLFFKL